MMPWLGLRKGPRCPALLRSGTRGEGDALLQDWARK